jgi:hypothetical protein
VHCGVDRSLLVVGVLVTRKLGLASLSRVRALRFEP